MLLRNDKHHRAPDASSDDTARGLAHTLDRVRSSGLASMAHRAI